LLVGILVIGPEQLPDFVKSSVKSFTKLQNKLFEFRASVERDIGAEDLKQDIFNELKMEELKRDDEPPK
jgi:sec-independent protein translocase protein TatB